MVTMYAAIWACFIVLFSWHSLCFMQPFCPSIIQHCSTYLTKSLFSPVIVTIVWGQMECSKFDIELNLPIICIFNSFGMSIDVISLYNWYLSIIQSQFGHILFGQICMNTMNRDATFSNLFYINILKLVYFVWHLH